jgi:ferrous iron transport protein A
MIPLLYLSEGEQGKIVAISSGGGGGCRARRDVRQCRAMDLGFQVGKSVRLIQKNGSGPILVKVDDSRIAIGRGIAQKIMVDNISVLSGEGDSEREKK